MNDLKCDICDKQYDRKCRLNAHMLGSTLCIKDINCKQLYLDHKKLNEDHKKLNEDHKELKDKLIKLQNDYNVIQGNNQLLELQMKDVINSKGATTTTINGDVNNYVIAKDAIPYKDIKWDTSKVDLDFIRNTPNSLTDDIKRQLKIDSEENVYNYCNTDITRNQFSYLNKNNEYVKDNGGNDFIERVLIQQYLPKFKEVIDKEYPVGVKIPTHRINTACDDVEISRRIFSEGSDQYNTLFTRLKKAIYMPAKLRKNIKFIKSPNNNIVIEEVEDDNNEEEVIEEIEEELTEAQEYEREYGVIDSSIVEDLYPNEPEIVSDSD
jgi:hypothetical protein